MGKLLISEEEKNYIKSLYNLITLKEQTEPPTPTSGDELTIEKKIDFPAGYYNASYLESLKPELDKIKNFLSSNPNTSYVVSLNIKSGESKIPNTDNESSAKNPLPQGELSKRRYETITNYVSDYWGSAGITNIDLIPGPVNAVSGETEWVGQEFCPSNSLKSGDEIGRECLNRNFNPKNGKPNWFNGKDNVYKGIKSKYDTEQFVYITMKVVKNQPSLEPCLNGMKIKLDYESGNHYCNSSVYELYINGNLLYRDEDGRPYASLNNGISKDEFNDGKDRLGRKKVFTPTDIEYYDNNIAWKGKANKGGERYNTFTISSELAKNLLSSGGDVFEITAICRNPTNQKGFKGGCHTDVGKIKIINGLGATEEYNITTPNKRDETVLLVKINACGKKINL